MKINIYNGQDWVQVAKDGRAGLDAVSPTPTQIAKAVISNSKFVESLRGAKGKDFDPESLTQALRDMDIDTTLLPTIGELWSDVEQLKKRIKSKMTTVFGASGNGSGSFDIGAVTTLGTPNSVIFLDGSKAVAQDNVNFNYVAATKTFTATRNKAGTANVFAPFTPATPYLANDVILTNNTLYKRIAGGTSGGSFNATERALWNEIGVVTELNPWLTATYYEVGDEVTNENRIYRTITAHTSGVFNTDRGNWTVIASLPLGIWIASTYYYADEEVYAPDGSIIFHTGSGISGATFDAVELALWTVKTLNQDIPAWAVTTLYIAGKLVTHNGKLIRKIANGASSGTFDLAESALWTEINAKISAFQATNLYYAGDLVTFNSYILSRNSTGVSAASMTAGEAANWTPIVRPSTANWVASQVYFAGDFVFQVTTGDLLKKIATGVTTATFDATESALWTFVETNASSPAWATGIYYYNGSKITQNGVRYERIVAGVSVATFVLDLPSNWQIVGGINNVRTIVFANSPYTIQPSDGSLYVDSTLGVITINLPATHPVGKFIDITRIAGANTVTLAGVGTTLINPTTALPVASYALGLNLNSTHHLSGTIYYLK